MVMPEKVLMRKIKKREKRKLQLMSKKYNANNAESEPQNAKNRPHEINEDCAKTDYKNSEPQEAKKRPHEINEDSAKTDTKNSEPQEAKKRPHEINEDSAKTDTKKKHKKQKADVKKEPEVKDENENGDSQNVEEADSDNKIEIKPNDESQLPGSSLSLSISQENKFSSLEGKVCERTLRAIKDMGFTTMTEIQAKALPPLLKWRNLVGIAKTGSGKTLAFLIPAIELVYQLELKRRNGTGVIILTPTRELAMQTYGVLMELMKYHRHTYGMVMGGANRAKEAWKLLHGVNILVATPGRLLDHMQNTPGFVHKHAYGLIIDEADRMLEIGYEEEIKQIIQLLPKERQNILFSATLTKKTVALIKAIGNCSFMHVGVEDQKQATVETLEQGFLLCPSEMRMLVLFTFLKRNTTKKVMVFLSTCLSVIYHYKLFNYIDLPVMYIHGKQEQAERTTTFFQFCNAESGILLCTDVAARGLDIPAVDWIIQYDPPDDPKEYIHRVGRTARGLGTNGHALMFLRREELGFLWYLKQWKVTLNQYEYSQDKVADIQLPLEKLLSRNYYLKQCAKDAYRSYLRAYDSHKLKNIFDINKIDLAKVAKSFGFAFPPAVKLNITKTARLQAVKAKASQSNKEQKTKIYRQKGGHKRFNN